MIGCQKRGVMIYPIKVFLTRRSPELNLFKPESVPSPYSIVSTCHSLFPHFSSGWPIFLCLCLCTLSLSLSSPALQSTDVASDKADSLVHGRQMRAKASRRRLSVSLAQAIQCIYEKYHILHTTYDILRRHTNRNTSKLTMDTMDTMDSARLCDRWPIIPLYPVHFHSFGPASETLSSFSSILLDPPLD